MCLDLPGLTYKTDIMNKGFGLKLFGWSSGFNTILVQAWRSRALVSEITFDILQEPTHVCPIV